jgi:3-oxoacyl-[acyl-carrier protein] reductase
MNNKYSHDLSPDWVPKVKPGSRLLVIGGSGGIGSALVNMLLESKDCIIGVHAGSKSEIPVAANTILYLKGLKSAEDCEGIVQNFVNDAGGIDGLVILVGGVSSNTHWTKISPKHWNADINLNLNFPFYFGQSAFNQMTRQDLGGKIIFTGTESALHGGGASSFAYGASKRATECLVQGMARDGGKHNIVVNGVRMGFIDSGFHQRWQGKTTADIKSRIEKVPLQRAGTTDEVAALITYLLSDWGNFITGQMIPITGGDWL